MADNVEIAHRHRAICDVCGILYDAHSAEEAEQSAVHHINKDIGDENPRPHYDHIIEITPVTVVSSI
jgi:hypothetical protein